MACSFFVTVLVLPFLWHRLSISFKCLGLIIITFVVFITDTSVQFSRSVESDSVTPWITACQASLSITNSRSSPRPTSIESLMPSSHLILLSSPSPPACNPSQHQSLFQWINSLHEVAKLCIIIIQSWKRLFYLLLADTYKCINCISSFIFIFSFQHLNTDTSKNLQS